MTNIIKRVLGGFFAIDNDDKSSYTRPPHNGGDVAMFHTGRCGSTVLGNMLNKHPKIDWATEIFEKHMQVTQEHGSDFVRKVINQSRVERGKRIYGFETKYLPQQHLSEACVDMGIEKYILLLNELGFKRYILLNRENHLRRAVSVAVARQNKRWHTKDVVDRPTKVHIDTTSFITGVGESTLLELFSTIDKQYNNIKKYIPADSLYLTYENDIQDDPMVAYVKVCDFLGVNRRKPKIKLRRTNPFALEDMIENYDEIKSLLSHTEYSWMIES